MRILFDKNVPLGIRRFLSKHEVRTIIEMGWPEQLENGKLLKSAEEYGFDVMVTSDQNIRYQQNLTGYASSIAATVDGAATGSYTFIEMPLPPKRQA